MVYCTSDKNKRVIPGYVRIAYYLLHEALIFLPGFGTMAVGENPEPGRPEKNWAQCLVDDLRVFPANEASTQSVPLVFGLETVL